MATKKPDWVTGRIFTKPVFFVQIWQQYGGAKIHVLFHKSRSHQI